MRDVLCYYDGDTVPECNHRRKRNIVPEYLTNNNQVFIIKRY